MVTDKQPSRTPTQEVPVVAEPYTEAWFLQKLQGHPTYEDCVDPECSICAWRDCPDHEPMHYHHDGCPCCDTDKAEDEDETGAALGFGPELTQECADCQREGRCMLHHPDAPKCVVVAASDPAPDVTEVKPVPTVSEVHFDVWPYGDRVWVERRVVGEHVDMLNRIMSGPRAFESFATAALRTGDELRSWGVRAFLAKAVVKAHAEEKSAPRLGSVDELWGEIDEPDLKVQFGGGCPIQGYGTAYGHPIYYRARGSHWSVDFWEPGVDVIEGHDLPDGEIWTFGRDDCAWPDAGWLHADESIIRIREAAEAFAAWKATK